MSPQALNEIRTSMPVMGLLAVPALGFLILLLRTRLWPISLVPAAGPREPPLWGLLELLFCLMGWGCIGIAAGFLALPLQTTPGVVSGYFLLVMQGISTAATLALVGTVSRRWCGQPWRTLGFARTPWTNALCPVLALLPMLIVVTALSYLWLALLHDVARLDLEPQPLVTQFRMQADSAEGWSLAAFIISGTVLAPILEETLFRGLIHGCLEVRWGFLPAAVVSSLIFAAVHFSLFGLVPLATLGFCLAVLYSRTRSLYVPMLFHGLFNGTSFTLLLLGAG